MISVARSARPRLLPPNRVTSRGTAMGTPVVRPARDFASLSWGPTGTDNFLPRVRCGASARPGRSTSNIETPRAGRCPPVKFPTAEDLDGSSASRAQERAERERIECEYPADYDDGLDRSTPPCPSS